MTQKDKQLLLTDLCGRLLYGVNVKTTGDNESYTLLSINSNKNIALIGLDFGDVYATSKIKIDECKPYLRPMSSMTEEEKDEMFGICTLSDCSVNTDWESVGVEIMSSHPRYGDHYSTDYSVIDWLNKNMFDYRGLIPKGLALEAPKGMYKEEQQ
jgi:hypothetical protein